jgi:outer membrane receptor for ferrienterochelin and colicin
VLEGFRRRQQTGLGTFITREEFDKRKPSLVTDILREVPGIDVASTGSGTRPVVRIGRAGNQDCATQIFVDGFLVNRRAISNEGYRPIDFRIDDAVSPASVEGIEIYKGLGTIPAEFLTPDAVCGVIAIWTRRGGDDR